MPSNQNSRNRFSVALSESMRQSPGGKFSTSQFWFNVVNLIVSGVYIMIGVAVYKSPTPSIGDFAFFTLVYAGIATGNKLASKFMGYKYASGSSTESTETKTVTKKEVDKDVVSDN